ncbi:hypothetical protein LTR36_001065 [Oleoguttula mirabilis]|uniref:Zn(2)-C6 fungal-type domain-containing protein n=1 Tax=Oleoguttula mirabilis TaxID=1507867 RepID=A0AAV9JQD1_9PEZI|nr:hypothetical protein LTR36_001065 [Oleoguttula mirabilis]
MDSLARDPTLSESSMSPEETDPVQTQAPKRTADAAGLKPGTRPTKSVKRRASKACQCCRSRKVRCNVVEHGAPCTNCRLDEVECIVSESKRKKKWTTNEIGSTEQQQDTEGFMRPNGTTKPMSAHPPYEPFRRMSEHTPHAVYQDLNHDVNLPASTPRSSLYTPNMLTNLQRLGKKPQAISEPTPLTPGLLSPISPSYSLPLYVKPLPARLTCDDILYLEQKGALTIPAVPLRDELLRCYAEFVHPYMPLLNIHELVGAIDRNNGTQSVSLLLFQAIMFTGVATADMKYLNAAGYGTRRDARREFFAKTRLLYDFDIEVDRISLIQALLHMTYWYETPDDQKDSHHWMGIAVSLSHTIGLHRNPQKSASMDLPRQRLWKRIWWSTYMRDRLVALGMRRPTRIKDEDFDVPMLELCDFELEILPEGPSCIPAECTILRDAEKQRQLAIMCIEKAKLCICISHVLSVQYSVLHNNHGVLSEEGSTKTTMMLVAKKLDPEVDEVQACDKELREWKENLAEDAKYVEPRWADVDSGKEDLVVNRSLLHMIYYATLSALHRPQVLPSTAMPRRSTHADQLEVSRKAVRLAASEITSIANSLYNLDLVKYLPTTGITTLLPAIIIHLLDIKAPDQGTRRGSLQGFCQCMQIMARLRDMYAAADYSTAFLEAAIRKAEITLPQQPDEVKEPRNVITSAQGLMDAGKRWNSGREASALTPPPDSQGAERSASASANEQLTDDDIARKLNSYLASTPPDSEDQHNNEYMDMEEESEIHMADFEPDFDSMINLDAAGDTWLLEDGAYAAMQGESSGFTLDMDWMQGMRDGGLTVPE